MNLTNDYLERLAAPDDRTVYSGETIRGMAAELLQLRSLRDVGDEEVDRMLVGIANDALLSRGVKETFVILRHIAIARGQTRTDAVNRAAEWAKECEGLQEEIERLKTKIEHKSQQVEAQVALVAEMQERYEDENSERLIVEKERDEVVELLKWIAGLAECSELKDRYEVPEMARLLEIVEGK